MDNTQKKRSEIDNNYKWDLTKIFISDEDFYTELNNLKKDLLELSNFRGKLINAKNILDYVLLSDNLERRLYKLYYYAHLNHDADTTNSKYQEMKGKVDDLIITQSTLTSFVEPELLKLDYQEFKKFYEIEPKLKEYEFNFENLYRLKNHVLSEKEEELLSSLGKTISNSEETFSSLTDSDMKFGTIMVDDKKVELTESNYSIYIKSNDRSVRKQAFTKLFETFGNYKNTIASTYRGNADTLTSIAKLRNFKSSIESSLFDENIDISVYDNLIETVNKNMETIYSYYDLKKEVLGVDDLHLYDVYVNLADSVDKKYTFLEAKKEVINALSILGDDYISNINKAFDEKWIDVYNSVGKRGGAYSSGFYDTNPYILLNFEGTIRDVSTLAHELGHSMHTYYSCKSNPYQYSAYQIFVAEVASTVNELLLNNYMLQNAKDNSEKLYILNELMELFRTTIYRQTMFAEFEKLTHKLSESGEVLTYDLLCSEYYKLNQKYFGNNVSIDDIIKYEWERIPHFYYNFYVYKYAIGLSVACYIVNGIVNKKENALENYLKFLKTGGSDYPINELKVAGVDATDSKVVESAINMFDESIKTFKKIYENR